MSHTHLITANELQALMQAGAPLMVFDCSFDLADTERGIADYHATHIPGAIYAHLDRDLSAAGGPSASGGRHPLPTRERFAAWLASVGFSNGMQAVVYDRNGSMPCMRLWWLFKWLGHDAAAVLDGGFAAWLAAGGASSSHEEMPRAPGDFSARAPLRRLLDTAQVLAQLGQSGQTLVDARAGERYRGEVEPLDPVAGHIPGALNRPWMDNLAPDGRFKSAGELRAEFDAVLQGRDAASVVHQCGSGVSAIHNLLAMELAGYAPAALYAGSWSAWCADRTRPVATG
ncbi:sulfurtransferase [Comamonas sp. NLF-1-9]|uniref:sulfurtransferase n=1 Tax=Comamonas sp. NLF-1-9 TaxID=2853163 RepID=UPI001C44D7A1|nr:sulfurtransferase [Comamonas sp. NLF-1-9]QXL84672.1 sulfurtransferase [Comamonas sp. NLF-1-9]